MSTAQLNNYRQSPRKVRLVADMARGKKIKEILPILDHLGKRAAGPVKKLLQSAVANAVHNENLDKDKLVVSEIRVDEGPTLKRSRPRARGRAFPIKKRTSRITVRLAELPIIKKTIVEKTEKKEESASITNPSVDKRESAATETKKENKNLAKTNNY